MLLEVWRESERILRPITKRRSAQDHRIEYITGGLLEFWSLDNPDAGRGRKYARVIIDEAAMIKFLMDAWRASIRPTLTDLKGDAWFLSTPQGPQWVLATLSDGTRSPRARLGVLADADQYQPAYRPVRD
jgi:hypothetical protein